MTKNNFMKQKMLELIIIINYNTAHNIGNLENLENNRKKLKIVSEILKK